MKTITDTEYIHALVAEEEHQQQDFKFGISDARKRTRSISAFANTEETQQRYTERNGRRFVIRTKHAR